MMGDIMVCWRCMYQSQFVCVCFECMKGEFANDERYYYGVSEMMYV